MKHFQDFITIYIAIKQITMKYGKCKAVEDQSLI